MPKIDINTIYKGDAYDLIKSVESKSVDLIVTDPPYKIEGLHVGTGLLKGRKNSHVDQMMETNLGDGIDLKILDEFVRVMKKINIYIWCNKEQLYDYMTYFVKERKCKFEIIVWAKPNPAPFTNGHYLKDKEYCLYFWEAGVVVKGSYETLKTYYIQNCNITDKKEFGHPTIKPIEIIKNLIRNSCGGGVIFDPFLGSGTTCVAAKELGMKYIGFEINENYFEIAKNRLNGINKRGEMDLFKTDFDKVQEEYNEQLNLLESVKK